MPYIFAPRPYGPDFKSGEFIDWEMLIPDVKRRSEIGSIFKYGRILERPDEVLLDSAEVPDRFRFNKLTSPLRDTVWSVNGAMIVSGAFHDLVEVLEPGLHQFLPLTMEGKGDLGRRYLFNVHHTRDSIVDELSNVEPHPSTPYSDETMYIRFEPKRNFKVTVDQSKLTGVNLWREYRYKEMLISDQLADEIKRRNLKVFPLWKTVQINERTY